MMRTGCKFRDRKANFPYCKVYYLVSVYDLSLDTRLSTFPTKRASESERAKGCPLAWRARGSGGQGSGGGVGEVAGGGGRGKGG